MSKYPSVAIKCNVTSTGNISESLQYLTKTGLRDALVDGMRETIEPFKRLIQERSPVLYGTLAKSWETHIVTGEGSSPDNFVVSGSIFVPFKWFNIQKPMRLYRLSKGRKSAKDINTTLGARANPKLYAARVNMESKTNKGWFDRVCAEGERNIVGPTLHKNIEKQLHKAAGVPGHTVRS